MSINLTAPNLTRLFNGALFADELETRYLAGVAMVYRLEPAAFLPGLDPAASIMAAIDLTLPVIDWDAPTRVDGITPQQKRISVVTYPVSGDSAPLTWIPRQRQLGMPSARFGIAAGGLAVVCTDYSATEDRVTVATTRARRYIETQQAHQATELQTWRDDTARRIRDTVNARRKLLDDLPA